MSCRPVCHLLLPIALLACGRTELFADATDGGEPHAAPPAFDASLPDADRSDAGSATDAGVDVRLPASDAAPDGGAPAPPVCTNPLGLQAGSPWPIWRRCPSRQAATSALGPGPGTPTIAWTKAPQGTWDSDVVVAADGTIYAHDLGHGVVAMAPDGGTLWTTTIGPAAGVGTWLAIGADGTVYAWNGSMTAIRPDGTRAWIANEAPWAPVTIYPFAIGVDGTLFVVNVEDGGGAIIAAIGLDGKGGWIRGIDNVGGLCGPPSVGEDGTLYVLADRAGPSLECWMFGISPSGELVSGVPLGPLDALQAGESPLVAPLVTGAGTVYAACDAGVCGFTPDGQTAAGTYSLVQAATPTAWSPQSGVLYAHDGTVLYAIAPDGHVMWQQPAVPSSLVDGRGTVFTALTALAGTPTAAIDPGGNVMWTVDGGIPVAVGGDGTLYTAPGPTGGSAPIVAIAP